MKKPLFLFLLVCFVFFLEGTNTLLFAQYPSICSGRRFFSKRQKAHTTTYLKTTTYYYQPKKMLFNGTDLTGWTNADGKDAPTGWRVEDGNIFREKGGGDLYTAEKYDHFILEFDYKIAPGANSGIKYRSWNTTGYGLGYEFQLLDDDVHSDGKNPTHRTASLYDILAPSNEINVRPVGEYNHAKIVVIGKHIEHWLNGKKAVSIDIDSELWKEKYQKSKFNNTKEFGTTTLGRILLQDHGDQIWFRNITIQEIKPIETVSPVRQCFRIFHF